MRVTVDFPTGDADCSSLIYRILVACGVMPSGYHFWTGNERSLLSLYGYRRVNIYHPERGDILWREGHTEMYLGDGMQGGARIDETGGVMGPMPGDQTGNEVGRSPFDLTYWRWEECWRYGGDKTVQGIPVPEATAQLMDHAIDHAAHGYSQPNRDGDGGTERVTIVWDDTSSLVVDGSLGRLSVTEWQRQLKTTADGVVSGQWRGNVCWFPNLTSVEFGGGGSSLVRAVQRKAGATVDGSIGPNTVKALQAWLRDHDYAVGAIDGVLGPTTARAVQRSLNAGEWR